MACRQGGRGRGKKEVKDREALVGWGRSSKAATSLEWGRRWHWTSREPGVGLDGEEEGAGTGSGEELWAPATAGDGGAPRVR